MSRQLVNNPSSLVCEAIDGLLAGTSNIAVIKSIRTSSVSFSLSCLTLYFYHQHLNSLFCCCTNPPPPPPSPRLDGLQVYIVIVPFTALV